jgi:hypothetical protein
VCRLDNPVHGVFNEWKVSGTAKRFAGNSVPITIQTVYATPAQIIDGLPAGLHLATVALGSATAGLGKVPGQFGALLRLGVIPVPVIPGRFGLTGGPESTSAFSRLDFEIPEFSAIAVFSVMPCHSPADLLRIDIHPAASDMRYDSAILVARFRFDAGKSSITETRE